MLKGDEEKRLVLFSISPFTFTFTYILPLHLKSICPTIFQQLACSISILVLGILLIHGEPTDRINKSISKPRTLLKRCLPLRKTVRTCSERRREAPVGTMLSR